LLSELTECVIGAIYGSSRIEIECCGVKGLTGMCAIAPRIAIGSDVPVAYSFVVPIARAIALSAIILLKSKDLTFVRVVTCLDITRYGWLSLMVSRTKAREKTRKISERGRMTRKYGRVFGDQNIK
jgi:hypothetical protein